MASPLSVRRVVQEVENRFESSRTMVVDHTSDDGFFPILLPVTSIEVMPGDWYVDLEEYENVCVFYTYSWFSPVSIREIRCLRDTLRRILDRYPLIPCINVDDEESVDPMAIVGFNGATNVNIIELKVADVPSVPSPFK